MNAATAATLTAVATGILAIATLVYALATRNLAMAARANIRAQVVSSARLAWIDSLRDAVAEFLSLDAEVKDDRAKNLGAEFLDNLIQRRLMIRHRIEFRLDADKASHVALISAIDRLVSEPSHSGATEVKIRALTVQIAENEWRRVRIEVAEPSLVNALGRGVRAVISDPSA